MLSQICAQVLVNFVIRLSALDWDLEIYFVMNMLYLLRIKQFKRSLTSVKTNSNWSMNDITCELFMARGRPRILTPQCRVVDLALQIHHNWPDSARICMSKMREFEKYIDQIRLINLPGKLTRGSIIFTWFQMIPVPEGRVDKHGPQTTCTKIFNSISTVVPQIDIHNASATSAGWLAWPVHALHIKFQ